MIWFVSFYVTFAIFHTHHMIIDVFSEYLEEGIITYDMDWSHQLLSLYDRTTQ